MPSQLGVTSASARAPIVAGPAPRGNLVHLLRAMATDRPDQAAFTYLADGEWASRSETYRELDLRARALATRLSRQGWAGQRALLMYPPGLDFVAGLFGCLYAGVVAVPVFPPRRNRNAQRLEAIARDAQASVTLAVSGGKSLEGDDSRLQSLNQLPCICTDEMDMSLADDWTFPGVDADSLAILQYTSGSTGNPRGVMLKHGNILHNCEVIRRGFETAPQDIGLSWLPAYHDMGLVGGILHSIYLGSHSFLMSPMAFLQKPARWLQALSRYRVTVSGGPNFAYDLCVKKVSDRDLQGVDLSCWSVAFNGAEPVRSDTLRQFGERFKSWGFQSEAFYPCYGLAESTLMVTGGSRRSAPVVRRFHRQELEPPAAAASPDAPAESRELVSSGLVRQEAGIQLMLVDPAARRPVPPGQIGEIWVASPSVGIGYYGDRALTDEVFHGQLAEPNGVEYLRTGDLGFLSDGQLFVTGRIKDLIILRGVKYYPHDIERTVETSHPALRLGTSAAFAVDEARRERLVIVCEVERSSQGDGDAVIEAIRRNVAGDHDLVPDGVVLIRAGSVPKTSSGKIQRHACRDGYLSRALLVVAEWSSELDRVHGTAASRAFVTRMHRPDAPGKEGTLEGDEEVPEELASAADILAAVKDAVRQVARDRSLRLEPNTSIVELGLDSLQRLEIVNRMEARFGGVFPEAALTSMETCQEVADAIREHLLRPHLAMPSCGEVPAEHYCPDRFPEYLQLRREADAVAEAGAANPYFRSFEGISRHTTRWNGRDLVLYSGYNYLGLSGHPAVSSAAQEAIRRYGTSVSASRLVSGERPVHAELEAALADFLECENAIAFVGGHATNVTTIGHLLGPQDLILHDALAHNSIIQGAQLSGAQRRPFPHNDWRTLDRTLGQIRGRFRRVLIAIEGAYSMDGDFPELPRFVELRNRHRALLLVDEAHSLGTMGATGRGIGEHFDVHRGSVDLWMGTLSKALGSCGGYIAGSRALVELLKYTAPGFVYSVGLSPPVAAAALEALRALKREPDRVARCRDRARLFLELASEAGLNTHRSGGTPIVPIMVGDSRAALELSQRLLAQGIVAHPILYPAVEESGVRLRFFITSEHTEDQIRRTVAIVAREWSRLGLPGGPTSTQGLSSGSRRSEPRPTRWQHTAKPPHRHAAGS